MTMTRWEARGWNGDDEVVYYGSDPRWKNPGATVKELVATLGSRAPELITCFSLERYESQENGQVTVTRLKTMDVDGKELKGACQEPPWLFRNRTKGV